MIPMIMKAVVLRGHGGFEQLDYCDVPVPQPASGEVLVKVGAAGVNNTDINVRVGWYSRAVAGSTSAAAAERRESTVDGSWSGGAFEFPRIQGADACGWIVAVGEGVAATRIGERVLVDPVLRPADGSLRGTGYLGAERDGAFAAYVTVPDENACAIASELEDTELASFPCAYSAAANMIARAEVRPGETVLVTGASGGVGSAAVQLACCHGARVIAVTTAAKAGQVIALGAAATLERADDPVAALGRESIDVVVDVVGGAGFAALLEVLRRGGRYTVAGAIAGPIVALDLRTVYLKDLRLLGCTVTPRSVFTELVRLIEHGRIRPTVSATFPLSQIAAAQSLFLEKRHTGKIVLVP
jgi:NADPH:quinone reductase-like Zn-dependent oxidoreductase